MSRRRRLPALVSVPEIAEMAEVDQSLVRTWVARGKLPTPAAQLRIGSIWFEDEIVDWIARGGAEKQAAPVRRSPQVPPEGTPARA